jgi:hypothetical protein
LLVIVEDYNTYQQSEEYAATLDSPTASKASLPSTLASYHARDPVSDFKHGIQHDALSFAIDKDNKQWDT